MTLNEELQVKCLQGCRGHVYLLYVSPIKRFQPSTDEIQPVEKGRQFQRNACDSHLVFQNVAYFSLREAYLLMKISCKFGEASWFPTESVIVKNLTT